MPAEIHPTTYETLMREMSRAIKNFPGALIRDGISKAFELQRLLRLRDELFHSEAHKDVIGKTHRSTESLNRKSPLFPSRTRIS